MQASEKREKGYYPIARESIQGEKKGAENRGQERWERLKEKPLKDMVMVASKTGGESEEQAVEDGMEEEGGIECPKGSGKIVPYRLMV
ncbi:unnamed protein product [Caretta caretta]